jgi:hypothetical protein
MRVDALIDQTRFPHPGLAHERHHLPMAGRRPRQGLAQGRQLGVAACKAGQPAGRRGLEAVPQRTRPDQVKDLHRRCQPLDRDRSQRVDSHEAFHQAQRRRGQTDGPRGRELLHACCQVGRFANSRVVHVQVVANRPHDDLPGVEANADLHLHAMARDAEVTVFSPTFSGVRPSL